jgi:hypothetical protein
MLTLFANLQFAFLHQSNVTALIKITVVSNNLSGAFLANGFHPNNILFTVYKRNATKSAVTGMKAHLCKDRMELINQKLGQCNSAGPHYVMRPRSTSISTRLSI